MALATAVDHGHCRGLTVAAVMRVYTIGYVAEMLGEDEEWLWDVANGIEPEDGHLWVYGVGEDGVAAFTDFGIENLKQTIADMRAAGEIPPSRSKTT